MRTPMRLIRQLRVAVLLISLSLPSALPLGVPSVPVPVPQQRHQPLTLVPPVLAGDWAGAKAALRNPDCCVVSVPGLEHHLRVLQAQFADDGPAELDLRAGVHVTKSSAHDDCLRVRRSVSPFAGDDHGDNNDENINEDDPCTAALVELARGFASLADGPLEGVCENVFIRIVCASDYRAIDPSFHTDKAPLRGYVTLRGVGTEFMTRPCSPMEYMILRGFGKGDPAQSVRRAEELEFIVMKGDHYEYEDPVTMLSTASWMNKVWKRTAACVHRSPPAAMAGGRRVIVSVDLGDGDDDREWYQANTKREWRSGMTQRKSRLVS